MDSALRWDSIWGGQVSGGGRKADKEMWARFYAFSETTGNPDEDDRGSLWLTIR